MDNFKYFKEKMNEAIKVGGPISVPKTLPTKSISLLNARLVDEYNAYFFYRNSANWCKNANYKKAAAFFESESAGELEHAIGIQNYLTQWNLIPDMNFNMNAIQFSSLPDIINKAYDIEYTLLQKYSDDLKVLLDTDPSTFNFVQNYVQIQVGEVEEYSDYLNALELIDVNSKFEVLYFEQTYF